MIQMQFHLSNGQPLQVCRRTIGEVKSEEDVVETSMPCVSLDRLEEARPELFGLKWVKNLACLFCTLKSSLLEEEHEFAHGTSIAEMLGFVFADLCHDCARSRN